MSRSSDSESDSASSEEEQQMRRKRSKKHKHKDEKKQKKHSKKKAKKQKIKKRKQSTSSSEDDNGPVVPSRLPLEQSDTVNFDTFGPALPPHLLKRTSEEEPAASIIGPIIPTEFLKVQETKLDDNDVKQRSTRDGDDDDDDGDDGGDMFGPLPVQDSNTTMSSTQIELEERALKLKLAAIDKEAGMGEVDQTVREEWMLELPEVGLKGGLAALNNLKRTFHQGKERPDFSDRSSWTKTPQTKEAAGGVSSAQQPSSSKDLEKSAIELYERQRDEEQERLAKKHKKKHKREESLVALHQKKLRKEQREKEKKLAGAKPERRPFTRDIDLKLNKIDSNQTKQIVDKAKILNTKFSSGHSKYL